MAEASQIGDSTQAGFDWKRELANSTETKWQVKYPSGWIEVPPCEAVDLGIHFGYYSIRLGEPELIIFKGVQL